MLKAYWGLCLRIPTRLPGGLGLGEGWKAALTLLPRAPPLVRQHQACRTYGSFLEALPLRAALAHRPSTFLPPATPLLRLYQASRTCSQPGNLLLLQQYLCSSRYLRKCPLQPLSISPMMGECIASTGQHQGGAMIHIIIVLPRLRAPRHFHTRRTRLRAPRHLHCSLTTPAKTDHCLSLMGQMKRRLLGMELLGDIGHEEDQDIIWFRIEDRGL